MARDSFVFYRNMWEQLLQFKDSGELLSLFAAICDYEFYGREPELSNPTHRAVWLGIKDKLDHDYKKYLKVCKRKKEPKKENDTDTVTDTVTDTEKNENDFFKERKEKFSREVFSVEGYSDRHRQTFVDYYTQPLQDNPQKMLYESYKAWDLNMKLAAWKPLPGKTPDKTTLRLKTPEEREQDSRSEFEAERRRIIEVVEAVRRDPTSPRAFLVEQWRQNGTLRKFRVES